MLSLGRKGILFLIDPVHLSFLENPFTVSGSENVFHFLFLFFLLLYMRVCNGCFIYLVWISLKRNSEFVLSGIKEKKKNPVKGEAKSISVVSLGA